MFRYLPPQASEFANKVDWMNNLITDLSVFFTVAIVGAMIYFAIKYRAKGGVNHETPQIKGSHTLEAIWTIVPTLICIYIAVYGAQIYHEMRQVDANAYEINVWSRQWKWDFEYPNGKKTSDEVVVPVNKPVKFSLHSKDVLHSFFLRDMRVKADAIPGRITYVSFKPLLTGTYDIFCTEYCGLQHSGMIGKLKVVSDAEFERWLNDNSEAEAASRMSPAKLGAKLYTEKGCNACHSLDGSRLVGPSFKGLFGREEHMSDGSVIKVDENYILESINNPNAKVVATYTPNLMPSFQGQLNDAELNALVTYLKDVESVKPAFVPKPIVVANSDVVLTPLELGKKLYNEKTCVACHSIDGSKMVGPSFKGIMGRGEKLTDGSTIVVDEAYIRKSIKEPGAQIVEGYQPVMPPMGLADAEIDAIIVYLKSL